MFADMKRSTFFTCFQIWYIWCLTITLIRVPQAVNTQPDSGNNIDLDKYIIIRSDAYSTLIYLRNTTLLQLLGDVWYRRNAMSQPIHWEQFSFKQEHGAYSIPKLSPNTTYLIRNVHFQGRFDVPDLQIQTCPEKPPRVQSLRLNEAGLGWLDIRWKQPREECSSVIIYKVSYKYMTTNGEFVTKTILFDVPKDDFFKVTHANVTHPCDTWPNEFCVLLTENIYPGINYEVQVQTGRYIFSSNTDQISEPISINVSPNVSNVGPFKAVQCHSREKKPRKLFREETDCTNSSTPPWIIIITSVFIATNVGIIITFLIRKCMKRNTKTSKRVQTSNKSASSNSSAIYDYPERQESNS